MGLIQLLIILIIVGAALYLLQRVPIDATIKNIIYVVVIVGVIVWLLSNIGSLIPSFK